MDGLVLGIAVAIPFDRQIIGNGIPDQMLHEDGSDWINEDGSSLVSEQ